MEFDTLQTGVYAIISLPRRERFTIPVNGCLFQSQLSHQISVRFAKKATDKDIGCDILVSTGSRRAKVLEKGKRKKERERVGKGKKRDERERKDERLRK